MSNATSPQFDVSQRATANEPKFVIFTADERRLSLAELEQVFIRGHIVTGHGEIQLSFELPFS